MQWRYSNGNTLFHRGSDVLLENILVEWNDCEPHDYRWHLGCILPRVPAIIVRTGTTIGGCAPGVYTGSSTMCLHDSSDNATVTRLTMRKNGRSAGLRPGGHGGKPPVLEFIHFSE